MGLPMFREPDEVVAEEAAAKLDRAAAIQRSAIRRQATVRPAREGRSETRRLSDRLDEVHNHTRDARQRDDPQNTDLHIAQLETELGRLRNIRLRQRFRHTRLSRPVLRDAMDLMRQSRDMFHDEDENNSTSTRAPSPVRRLPRPARESNLRFEVEASRSVSPRRLRMLSPPSSSGSGRNNVPFEEPHNLTPGFAPARGPYDGSPRPDEEEDMPTPPPEILGSAYPHLRRVGHLSPRPYTRMENSRGYMDGLGDRRRSPSPEHEEETWANLLTTMDDESTTTTATSFTSDANSRSRSSQNTTATSFGEIGPVDDSCDLDLPSGITEDDVRTIREQHRRLITRDHDHHHHRQQHNQPDGPIMTGERAERDDRGLREHHQHSSSSRFRRGELGMFQSILERMQRREEIPDEWWAAVGLTPDVVRGT